VDGVLDWRAGKRAARGSNRRPPEGLAGFQPPPGFARAHGAERPMLLTLADGEQLKYCPGTRCRMYLPLFQFAGNLNMADGRDTYCTECNHVMRRSKFERRRRVRLGLPATDKFEAYCREEAADGSPGRAAVMRALQEALGQEGTPFTAAAVYSKLFHGRRLICEVTGECITPACFLEHHSVRVVAEDGKASVRCTRCRVPE
jgi:hypothetical protein